MNGERGSGAWERVRFGRRVTWGFGLMCGPFLVLVACPVIVDRLLGYATIPLVGLHFLVGWLVLGWAAAEYGTRKRIQGGWFTALCVLLPPIAVVIAGVPRR